VFCLLPSGRTRAPRSAPRLAVSSRSEPGPGRCGSSSTPPFPLADATKAHGLGPAGLAGSSRYPVAIVQCSATSVQQDGVDPARRADQDCRRPAV